MSTGSVSHEAHLNSVALDQAVERVIQALSSAAEGGRTAQRLLRVEVPVSNGSPLQWLRAQPRCARVYWSDRDGMFETAGLGEAYVVSGAGAVDYTGLFAGLRDGLGANHPNLSFFGGFQFDSTKELGAAWAPFGSYRFIIPKFELFRIADAVRFACTVVTNTEASFHEQLAITISELRALSTGNHESRGTWAPPRSRRDTPDYDGWAGAIHEALLAAGRGAIEKIVLARESRFTFSDSVDALGLLERLVEVTPNSYHFCFQPSESAAFIGASPERLFRREGLRIESEALAGTRPRGTDDASDEAFGNALLNCDKDIREHRFVFDALNAAFRSLCESTTADPGVSLIKLQVCQHLWRRIEGVLRESVSDPDVLRALHPTPAVGGFPTGAALELIPRLEGFNRGWYAGPVGRVSHDAAEFAVAIRSGLVHDSTLTVYSGAGILPGSRPESEWAEIENKMGTFLSVLSGHVG